MIDRINVNTERDRESRQTRTTDERRRDRNPVYIVQDRSDRRGRSFRFRAHDFENDEALTDWAAGWEIEGHQGLAVESPSQKLRQQANRAGVLHPPIAFIEFLRDGAVRVKERENRIEIGVELF